MSDIERITKRFYERFRNERVTFLSHIQGIATHPEQEHYAELLLNRLMFVYFIQHKGFLDDDSNYLSNRLYRIRQHMGPDIFFRHFLQRLFHEGLAQPTRTEELQALLGNIPYLDSDLFTIHAIECAYPTIMVPDIAFMRLFAFFNAYHWHQDESSMHPENTLTPAILGYIFEKYINQQEMGAYYTKEDITSYIARNTIIPAFFDALSCIYPEILRSDGPIWQLLSTKPDRYIPQLITVEPPGETEYEYTTRHTYVTHLRSLLAEGHIHNIDDLITYNLDICRFAQDALRNTMSTELLLMCYMHLQQLTILDPTCGSGAFLFAALDILQPLYEACLDGLADHSPLAHTTSSNRAYYIVRYIITHNLYGVDIMEQATSICKLRLFLKLVAQIEHTEDIEPLPRINHNIRTGNALVGHIWQNEFDDILDKGGFNVIIGNPPYVEYNVKQFAYTLHGFQTLDCSNLYPCVIEHSRQLLAPAGRHGMIVPLAAFATRNMIPLIEGFLKWFPCSWLSFYHFRPSMLFSGGKIASIPTVIYLAKTSGPERRFSTHLAKWPTEQRDQLFSRLTYCLIDVPRDPENLHYYPKFGHMLENSIMQKILCQQPVRNYLAAEPNQNTMFYRSAGGLYWKVFVNFPWPYQTTSNKHCYFKEGYERDVFVALFNSSLFWWYYTVTFDTFNLKNYMLFGFRFTYPQEPEVITELQALCQRLMNDFRRHARHLKRGPTGSYTVYARRSKAIIDEIDHVLARYYGFSDEELDFIINYDIKYRIGWNAEKL